MVRLMSSSVSKPVDDDRSYVRLMSSSVSKPVDDDRM